MRIVSSFRVRGLTLAMIAVLCAHCGSKQGATVSEGPDTSDADAGAAAEASDTDANPDNFNGKDASIPDSGGDATVVGSGGNDKCAAATAIPLSALNPRVDLLASTVGATHDIDAPCAVGQGPDVFYKFSVSRRVFVYADTFGASWNTVLFLLSDTCEPITTTTTGDAVCNDDRCGTTQSQIVALLEPGTYRLGLGGAAEGAATIHFEWALAGSGTATPLPKENSVQMGNTAGGQGSNIDGISSTCLAAGPEDSYWWARCPSDPAKTLKATTCAGGTTWESVLETQIPKAAPGLPAAYKCNLDGCGLQASLTTPIPAGAGLGVLSVDGQSGNDVGPYTMTVTYTP